MRLRQAGYSVIQACQWLGMSRSSFYYEPIGREDQEIEFTIQSVAVDLSEYRDFADAHQQIGNFIEALYNQKRIHSALD